jgi:hypothetical protein
MPRLADDLEGLQAQVATLTLENDSLRAELSVAPADVMDQVTDEAVSVLNQAQQLADSLIGEAMQSARDLVLTARSQQRDVMEQAKVAANGAVSRATAIAERAGSQDPSVATSNTSGCSPRWPTCSSRPCSMHSTSTSAGSVSCPEPPRLRGPARDRADSQAQLRVASSRCELPQHLPTRADDGF